MVSYSKHIKEEQRKGKQDSGRRPSDSKLLILTITTVQDLAIRLASVDLQKQIPYNNQILLLLAPPRFSSAHTPIPFPHFNAFYLCHRFFRAQLSRSCSLDQAGQGVGDDAEDGVEDSLDSDEEAVDNDVQAADEATDSDEQRADVDEDVGCRVEY